MDTHHVIQAEAGQVFFSEPLLLLLDEKHSATEARYHAYGKTDDGRTEGLNSDAIKNGRAPFLFFD